jgi:hypothetical protein
MKLSTKIIGLAALAGVALSSTGYVLFSGSPKWPLSGGFHYVTTLRNASFGNGSSSNTLNKWNLASNWALADMRDLGDTSFKPGIRRANDSHTNHGDGKNVWIRFSTTGGYLAVTFVRWSGSTMKDCDIWYNTRYAWTTGIYGSDVDPARSSSPYDFRNVARHEALHAIGFNHENRTLANMNSLYSDGGGVPDQAGSGVMPHATDKHGVRVLYTASTTARNVHSGRWRNPTSTTGSTGARRLTTTGSWAAGATRAVACWLSNQSNVSIAGGSTGIRVGVYLSKNNIISTGDTRIGEYTFSGSWPAHAASYYNLNGKIPSTQPAGTYYLGVIFDNRNIVVENSAVRGNESDNDALVGKVTVTNTIRTLTVRSTNPSSGVAITVSRTDRNGLKNGSTTFSRQYWGSNAGTVSVTAPASVGINPFRRWRLSTGATTSSRTMNVSLTGSRTAYAEYWRHTHGSFSVFGTGCPGTNNRVPILRGSGHPDLKQPITIRCSNAKPSSFGRLNLGISKTSWNGIPLPLALKFIGMGSCTLDVSLDIEIPIVYNSSGVFQLNTTVPNNSFDIGRHFYLQCMVIDAGAPTPLKVVHSNGLDILIGGNK